MYTYAFFSVTFYTLLYKYLIIIYCPVFLCCYISHISYMILADWCPSPLL